MKACIKAGILIIFWSVIINLGAVEVKYAFKKGNAYTYQYSQQSTSKAGAFTVKAEKKAAAPPTSFTVKAIDFQDGAFILDIGNKDATFRRYIKENGEIKGAPGETGQMIPFFLTFPESDWKVSEKHQFKKDFVIGNETVSAAWNLLLKSIDSDKGTAEILFAVSMKLPEDRLRLKHFSLKGRAVFNLFEGVLHQAEWNTAYDFNFSNKEIAVTRDLWRFEKQSSHSIIMTGVQE